MSSEMWLLILDEDFSEARSFEKCIFCNDMDVCSWPGSPMNFYLDTPPIDHTAAKHEAAWFVHYAYLFCRIVHMRGTYIHIQILCSSAGLAVEGGSKCRADHQLPSPASFSFAGDCRLYKRCDGS